MSHNRDAARVLASFGESASSYRSFARRSRPSAAAAAENKPSFAALFPLLADALPAAQAEFAIATTWDSAAPKAEPPAPAQAAPPSAPSLQAVPASAPAPVSPPAPSRIAVQPAPAHVHVAPAQPATPHPAVVAKPEPTARPTELQSLFAWLENGAGEGAAPRPAWLDGLL